MSAPYDLVIIGGGLAGWALARALPALDFPRVALLDAHDPMRASDAPGALLHALPGRSLDPDPLTMRAFAHASAWVERLLHEDPKLARRHVMLRPLKPGKPGRRFVTTYERGRHKYPECMHHEHIDAQTMAQRYPTLAPFEGAIAYGPAYMVQLPKVLRHIQSRLQNVEHIQTRVHTLEQVDDHWMIHTDTAPPLRARQVALCPGTGLGRWFPHLGIEINAGELLVCQAPVDGFSEAISGGGHIAQDPQGRWVMGATYLRPTGPPEDLTSWARDDEQAHGQILALLGQLVPQVHNAQGEIWRGRRAVRHPSRAPVCGGIPGHDGLFVLGALGSKGLLWSPWLAAQLADQLANKPTPELDQSPMNPHHPDFSHDHWLLEHTQP